MFLIISTWLNQTRMSAGDLSCCDWFEAEADLHIRGSMFTKWARLCRVSNPWFWLVNSCALFTI